MNKRKLLIEWEEWRCRLGKDDTLCLTLEDSIDEFLSQYKEPGETISGAEFENNCRIYVDADSDLYIFEYKGEEIDSGKSKFSMRVVKERLKQKLNV